ncbi:NitT/TauT family transport system permease protein [Geomicrobium halophilum]|uniref:NitT/TauT family transport system permease protein n=1 Tax=Geomicrobium halophilum TaxID=549000 RepID=A0A841PZG9_9BACL|nr:ABC transporter permease [Geomicrobium halophilum]MBB6448058.1 NitT/TauT family transport system permease protein [Geomicrobium halophilum]
MNPKLHEQHAKFRLQQKREKWYVVISQLILLITFFFLWEIASRFNWIDPLIFSSPSNVWGLFIEMTVNGTLYTHMGVTLLETILGFLIGTIGGILMAAFLWWFPFLSRVLDPYIVALNATPKVALGPMLIVIFGANMTSVIAMGVLISIIVTTLVIYGAFNETDKNLIKVVDTFGASTLQKFYYVILPASYPSMVSALKVNVGLAWVGVIVGEYLVSNEGLGYMIIYGFQVFNFNMVMLSLVLVVILATLMYQVVAILEKFLMRKRR